MIQFLAEIRQQITVWRFEHETIPLWNPEKDTISLWNPVRNILVPIKREIINELEEIK